MQSGAESSFPPVAGADSDDEFNWSDVSVKDDASDAGEDEGSEERVQEEETWARGQTCECTRLGLRFAY